jgi:hypothetical protein
MDRSPHIGTGRPVMTAPLSGAVPEYPSVIPGIGTPELLAIDESDNIGVQGVVISVKKSDPSVRGVTKVLSADGMMLS